MSFVVWIVVFLAVCLPFFMNSNGLLTNAVFFLFLDLRGNRQEISTEDKNPSVCQRFYLNVIHMEAFCTR